MPDRLVLLPDGRQPDVPDPAGSVSHQRRTLTPFSSAALPRSWGSQATAGNVGKPWENRGKIVGIFRPRRLLHWPQNLDGLNESGADDIEASN